MIIERILGRRQVDIMLSDHPVYTFFELRACKMSVNVIIYTELKLIGLQEMRVMTGGSALYVCRNDTLFTFPQCFGHFHFPRPSTKIPRFHVQLLSK